MVWLVAGAAAAGALARYLLDVAVQDRHESVFPFGTLVVNVSGSFALGVLTGLALYHGLGTGPRTVVGIGFLGSYTTFSTFSYETVRLVQEGSVAEACLNALASVGIGLAAAAAGLALAAAI